MSGGERVPVDSTAVWPEDAEDETALLLGWYVTPGDRVDEGARLCVFQVEKVDVDVPAPAAGDLTDVRVAADEEFERGDTLAVVDSS
jgi:pyruvate/2-oxoglutarate dehydrogenase complex dihydrolipoamide acyltransferase (E2) component